MEQLLVIGLAKGFRLIIKAIVVTFIFSTWFGAKAHTLTIELDEFEVQQGTVMLALFKGEQSYDQGSAPYAQAKKKVSAARHTLAFSDLTDGEYAVKVMHDENDNGSLDTNLFGVPTEGYGFSNNGGSFGPASFEEAKVIVQQDMSIQIHIR